MNIEYRASNYRSLILVQSKCNTLSEESTMPNISKPHCFYNRTLAYRPLAGKARMETLKATEKAGLDDVGDGDATKPSIEILSLNGGTAEATLAGLEGHNVSGPLASLQEGVIGGIEVDPGEIDSQTGKILASRPDHLTLTYEIDVAGGESLGDGGARRATKVGGEAGRGRGAWVSDAEDGGLEELGDASVEKESDLAEDADGRGVHRRKAKGSKLQKRKTQDKGKSAAEGGFFSPSLLLVQDRICVVFACIVLHW